MTSSHPLRRLLARLCSPDTMARVVGPTLADIRWEHHRARWRGYVSLASALTLHAVSSIPARVAGVWSEDGCAIPRVTLLSIGAAVVAAALLMAWPLLQSIRTTGASRGWLTLMLLPGALVLTLPVGLLVAIPSAIARLEPNARLIRRIVLLSVLFAGATFGLTGWIVPATNQAYRVAVSGIVDLPRGQNEQPFTHIKKEIERLRSFHGSDTVVRRMEYEYELRLALTAAAVPFGLAGLAVAFSRHGRKRPLLIGIAGVGLYVFIFVVEPLLVEFVLRRTSLPATPLAWLPNAVLVLIAGVLMSITVRQSANRQSPIASRQ